MSIPYRSPRDSPQANLNSVAPTVFIDPSQSALCGCLSFHCSPKGSSFQICLSRAPKRHTTKSSRVVETVSTAKLDNYLDNYFSVNFFDCWAWRGERRARVFVQLLLCNDPFVAIEIAGVTNERTDGPNLINFVIC